MISGTAMELILEQMFKEFVSFLLKCEGVVLFRSSPAQKSKVVNFVKKHEPEKKTLSIGDGINDVAMIQKAHIGIGIMGKEGN
jgi:magnesium-transporting ATPase (P-type)